MLHCHINGAAARGPTVFFWGQLLGVKKFDVLYTTETCIIWALAAAELQQKYIASLSLNLAEDVGSRWRYCRVKPKNAKNS